MIRIYKPVTGRLHVETPYRADNRAWFKGLGIRPVYDRSLGHWLISRTHFGTLIREGAKRFGGAQIWTDHYRAQICTVSCQTAVGEECVCSCAYRNHGGRVDGHDPDTVALDSEFERAYWEEHYVA